MRIFGSNGFGSFIRCDGPRLAQTIVQQELFPRKKRKKTCDFKRSVSDSELKKGDVLCVHRMGGAYDHYAIYIGNRKVIHYSDESGDAGKDIRIREATLSQFKNGPSEIFVIDFEAYRDYIENPELFDFEGLFKLALDTFFGNEIHLYSPEETVERAKSRLGERAYNLLLNNCEHFAIWCKTGKSESTQVQNFIDTIADINPGPVVR